MPTMPPEFEALFKGTLNFSVLLLGLVSGVAQLADLSAGPGRASLAGVCLASVLYFLARFGHAYFVLRVRRLRGNLQRAADLLAAQRFRHRQYLDAIERISDREKPLFHETLDVTVTIGDDDEGDRVVERRVTTPGPLVTHRTMRPIVPTDDDAVRRLDEIAFRVRRCDGGGNITALPLREQIRMLRVWIVFDPALTADTEWEVEYRPRGLWKPLRQRGWDQLSWDDRLPTAHGSPSAFTRFTVTFVFPYGDQAPVVHERLGYGHLAEPVRDERGSWRVVWCDDQPDGRHYVWDLTQAGRPASPLRT
ncbi:hypothetical protein [Mangrovihabitans endophyticus]|uniref:Uncharacterized protein n=1 Tax=Mangrovihabitans endophyticus TaxID=1751298 RepID=A0A8J3C538_9ACTN|nr:hypothetical protein [Mangrovihabitans endophyticus]GGL19146.1 hypothetical protein GCM10012284_62110 [Mangrovihabitans endophyticus]